VRPRQAVMLAERKAAAQVVVGLVARGAHYVVRRGQLAVYRGLMRVFRVSA
jgi:hypothetical protein